MSTAKVSIAIGEEELAWARALARREGKSLSAIISESIAERRRLTALREVVEWMAIDQPPLSKSEIAIANAALAPPARAKRSPPRRRT